MEVTLTNNLRFLNTVFTEFEAIHVKLLQILHDDPFLLLHLTEWSLQFDFHSILTHELPLQQQMNYLNSHVLTGKPCFALLVCYPGKRSDNCQDHKGAISKHCHLLTQWHKCPCPMWTAESWQPSAAFAQGNNFVPAVKIIAVLRRHWLLKYGIFRKQIGMTQVIFLLFTDLQLIFGIIFNASN